VPQNYVCAGCGADYEIKPLSGRCSVCGSDVSFAGLNMAPSLDDLRAKSPLSEEKSSMSEMIARIGSMPAAPSAAERLRGEVSQLTDRVAALEATVSALAQLPEIIATLVEDNKSLRRMLERQSFDNRNNR
jgi:hypothetical protein